MRPPFRQNAKKWQSQAADREKINPASHEERRPMVDAKLPVSPKDRKEKEG